MDAGDVLCPPLVGAPLRLHPFRGVMLAARRVGNPATGRALARPYREALRRLQRWQASGDMVRDERAAVYLHEYTSDGRTVRGLVGALDVSHRAAGPERAAVLPHEGIHPALVRQLADQMAALGLNPAPILLVHRGPEAVRDLLRRTTSTPAARALVDRGGQQHRLWPLRDDADLALLDAALASARVMIADGHHRCAAYQGLQQRRPGTAWDRGLAMLVDLIDTPLSMGAIHRRLHGVDLGGLAGAVHGVPGASYQYAARGSALSVLSADTVVVTDGRRWGTVRLATGGRRSAVEVLHEELIPRLPVRPAAVTYHHSLAEATTRLRGGADIAVLLPAPTADLVQRLTTQCLLLPEKATSFQPKPNLGVLMRSLPDG